MRYFLVLIFFAVVTGSCRKDPDTVPPPAPQPAQPSDIMLTFSPVVAGQGKIARDTVYYANHLGDKFTVSLFKYYISNITLVSSDNTVFTEPESYHLISHFEGNESFVIRGVPKGDYKKIKFMIGVDSARNVSGAQTGDLDVSNNMFWDWNTGYIFYKLEGSYTALSTNQGDYAFHIGGFSGPHRTIEIIELDIPGAQVGDGTITTMKFLSDAGAIFDKPHPMSFDEYFQTKPSEKRDKVQSTNYRDMFSVETIQVNKK